MKKRLTIIIFCLFIGNVQAQHNLQLQYGYRGGLAASRFLPSTFDMKEKSFSLETNFNVYFSNRAINYESFRTVSASKELSNQDIDQFLVNLNNRNTLTVGQDFLLLGVGFRTKINKSFFNWGVTLTDRAAVHLIYRKSLFELLLRGNRPFAGQTIELSPELRGRYFREIALNNTFKIKKSKNLGITFGYQLKYYWLLAGVFLENANLDFFTEETGRSLNIDYDYVYFSSGINDFSLTNSKGNGLGLSLGTTFEWQNRLAFDVAVNDLGAITFKKDVAIVKDSESFTFEGLDGEGLKNVNAVTDSISALIENEEVLQQSFRRPVGTQLLLQLSYQFTDYSSKENPTRFYLTYIQGFNEQPGISTNPRVIIAAHTRLFKSIYFGLNTAFGGLNPLAIGGLVGIRIRNLRFSIQSDDFTGFILPSKGTGIGLGFTFRYSK